jgi:hypothetical protein
VAIGICSCDPRAAGSCIGGSFESAFVHHTGHGGRSAIWRQASGVARCLSSSFYMVFRPAIIPVCPLSIVVLSLSFFLSFLFFSSLHQTYLWVFIFRKAWLFTLFSVKSKPTRASHLMSSCPLPPFQPPWFASFVTRMWPPSGPSTTSYLPSCACSFNISSAAPYSKTLMFQYSSEGGGG